MTRRPISATITYDYEPENAGTFAAIRRLATRHRVVCNEGTPPRPGLDAVMLTGALDDLRRLLVELDPDLTAGDLSDLWPHAFAADGTVVKATADLVPGDVIVQRLDEPTDGSYAGEVHDVRPMPSAEVDRPYRLTYAGSGARRVVYASSLWLVAPHD